MRPPPRIDLPARRPDLSAFIARLSKQLLGERVHHHIARPRIEGENFPDRRIRRNRGEIGDPPNVESDPSYTLITIKQVVEIRHQRRACAPGGHISWAEIRYHRNAG